MMSLSRAVKSILILNIIMFVASFGLQHYGQEDAMTQLVGWHFMNDNFQFSQLITHMFMHGGFMHIFFNMFGLWMFGTMVESQLGSKRFISYYLIAGLGGYLLHCLLSMNNIEMPMVGASGAVYGLLVGFATLFPEQKVSIIFLPWGFKAKYFVGVLVLMEILLGLFSGGGGIAHWAHVGGGLVGFILMTYVYKKSNLKFNLIKK